MSEEINTAPLKCGLHYFSPVARRRLLAALEEGIETARSLSVAQIYQIVCRDEK
jgi:hypothetical protein